MSNVIVHLAAVAVLQIIQVHKEQRKQLVSGSVNNFHLPPSNYVIILLLKRYGLLLNCVYFFFLNN
jgi:hypothetical protein